MGTHQRVIMFLGSPLFLLCVILCCYLKEGYAFDQRILLDREELLLHQHSHTVVEISSLLPASHCTPSPQGNNRGASSLEVVHRHGPCSPLITQNDLETTIPTAFEILSQDQYRVASIHSRLAGKTNLAVNSGDSTLPTKSGSSLGTGNYVVTVGIGTPKKDISLVFDTGSDLTWTQCQPCVKYCYKQQQPIFDPTKSSSYSNISCNSPDCSKIISGTGNIPGCASNTCVYGIQYGDQSYSVGYFAKDKLTLSADQVFDEFLFGCGQNNRGLFGKTAGLMGLGRDQISLVSQTAKKFGKYFSYCLPSMSSSSGYLTFGNNGVSTSVKFTQLLTNPQGPSFYFLDVKGIIVGGQSLSISPMVFSNAGTIIDSGTVITRLPATAYTAMKGAFREQMKKYPLTEAVSLLDTCYDLSNYTTVTIPKIGFTFAQNVKMDVAPSGILLAVSPSQVCLAFAGNGDDSNVGIFGNVQQQTHSVVYDVAGGKLGFAAGGCV